MGEVEDAREAHARYFVRFAQEMSADITGRRRLEAMERARTENPNTMPAANWLVARARRGDGDAVENGLLLCGGLCWPRHIHGLHLTGAALVDIFLSLSSAAPPTRGGAMAGYTASMMRSSIGDLEGALEAANRAHEDGVGKRWAARRARARRSWDSPRWKRPGDGPSGRWPSRLQRRRCRHGPVSSSIIPWIRGWRSASGS